MTKTRQRVTTRNHHGNAPEAGHTIVAASHVVTAAGHGVIEVDHEVVAAGRDTAGVGHGVVGAGHVKVAVGNEEVVAVITVPQHTVTHSKGMPGLSPFIISYTLFMDRSYLTFGD